MYQHLSETAKDVLKLAEALAQNDHQEYVGTEHVLKAIMDHGLGIGAQVLQSCSVSTQGINDHQERLRKPQMEETRVVGRLPRTPHCKQVIANAIEEAERVNDNKVGTEYLLLGLLREKGSVAERALRQLGVDLELARQKIAQFQGRSHPK